jgi:hypothetical protein
MKIIFKNFILLFMLFSSIAYAFNNSTFKGNYGFRFSGLSSYVLAHESETVATGVINADGKGHISGHGSFRTAGITCIGTISGIYNVNGDGTGIISSVFNTNTPGCFNGVLDLSMVIFNQGNGVEVANTENDYLSGTLHRQILK